jgi:hypothetical protein
MLVLAIIFVGLGIIVSAFAAAGAVGTGAVGFALGFYLLAALSLASHVSRFNLRTRSAF